ncbi:hypothetical protein AB0C12_36520 [Actinoplanes sp. NPDC048967]|uniref:hypothetical protein n=1 Tax=Actinoplanes sp. NPDC048967 TaxID=3155269 RepID=UPI0034084BB9
MSQSVDLPPPRRPLFFPVVIATVLLSIIGMSAGLVLGSRHETPRQTGEQTDGQAPYVPTEPALSPGNCPPEMHATARRVLGEDVRLTKVLQVRTLDTGTTVWICRDDTDRLFYQANRGGAEGKWIEGETALFLENVEPRGDGYFARAADGNTFDVNSERLEVVRKGEKKTYKVTTD